MIAFAIKDCSLFPGRPRSPPYSFLLGLADAFLYVRRLGREADHSHLVPRLRMCGVLPPFPHLSSWRFSNVWSYTSIPPFIFMAKFECVELYLHSHIYFHGEVRMCGVIPPFPHLSSWRSSNAWSYTSIPPFIFMVKFVIKQRNSYTYMACRATLFPQTIHTWVNYAVSFN